MGIREPDGHVSPSSSARAVTRVSATKSTSPGGHLRTMRTNPLRFCFVLARSHGTPQGRRLDPRTRPSPKAACGAAAFLQDDERLPRRARSSFHHLPRAVWPVPRVTQAGAPPPESCTETPPIRCVPGLVLRLAPRPSLPPASEALRPQIAIEPTGYGLQADDPTIGPPCAGQSVRLAGEAHHLRGDT